MANMTLLYILEDDESHRPGTSTRLPTRHKRFVGWWARQNSNPDLYRVKVRISITCGQRSCVFRDLQESVWTPIGRQEAFVVGERVQDAIVTVFCFLSSMIFLRVRRRLALASLS